MATYSLIPILDPAPPAEGGALVCGAQPIASMDPICEPSRMPQERDFARSKAFLKALIRVQNGSLTIDCVVRNISSSGAKIEVAATYVVPDEFELEIPQRGSVLQCALKWRKDAEIGMKFLHTTELRPHTPPAQSIEDLRRQNARLRRENARLKLRVEELAGER